MMLYVHRSPPATRGLRRGFTLVELMIVVAIIGVLAALAIFGVRKYLAAAKTSEAKDSIGAITRAVLIVFDRERAVAESLAEGNSSVILVHILCDSATPVPAAVPPGNKYQPDSTPGTDFETGDGATGWICLNHYASINPIYYQYHYNKDAGYVTPAFGPIPGTPGFEAAAVGDLDGDSQTSLFSRTGEVRGTNLLLSTQVFVAQEFE